MMYDKISIKYKMIDGAAICLMDCLDIHTQTCLRILRDDELLHKMKNGTSIDYNGLHAYKIEEEMNNILGEQINKNTINYDVINWCIRLRLIAVKKLNFYNYEVRKSDSTYSLTTSGWYTLRN